MVPLDEEEVKGQEAEGDINEQNVPELKSAIGWDDESPDFIVENPMLVNGHIEYHVKGIDKEGVWEG